MMKTKNEFLSVLSYLVKGYAIYPFSLICRSQSSSYLSPLLSCAFAVYHKYSRNLNTAAVILRQTSCVFLLRSRRRRKPPLTSPTGREAKWTAWRFCRNPTLKRRLGALLGGHSESHSCRHTLPELALSHTTLLLGRIV